MAELTRLVPGLTIQESNFNSTSFTLRGVVDLATPTNRSLASSLNASTCLRMLSGDPPNLDGARATAQRTLRDGNRASEAIQRLRAMFARKQPATEPVDLNNAAQAVLALSFRIQRSRVVLRTDFAPSLPIVTGDRVQLQQVVMNLVVNAINAMKASTIALGSFTSPPLTTTRTG